MTSPATTSPAPKAIFLLAGFGLLAACGSFSPQTSPDAPDNTSQPAPQDSNQATLPASDGTGDVPGTPSSAASSGSWSVQSTAVTKTSESSNAVSITASGGTGNDAMAIAIVNGVGTFTRAGRNFDVVISERGQLARSGNQPAPNVFFFFGADATALVSGAIVCTGSSITRVSTGGPSSTRFSGPLPGTCAMGTAQAASAMLPATSFTVTPPASLPTISGSVTLAPGAPGHLMLGQVDYDVLPYATTCANCAGPGLGNLAVSVVLRGKAANDICLGDIVLATGTTPQVLLTTFECLTSSKPSSSVAGATYTLPAGLGTGTTGTGTTGTASTGTASTGTGGG